MVNQNADTIPPLCRCRRLLRVTIQMARITLFILPVLMAAHADAQDSLRCRNRLVEIGDPSQEVRKLCGAPDNVHMEERFPDAWISKYEYDPYGRPRLPYLIDGPIHYERWTYHFGSNRLPYRLYFENGFLVRIESGSK